MKSKLLGMGLLALTAGLIGLLALSRGEKQPSDAHVPMFPAMRVRLEVSEDVVIDLANIVEADADRADRRACRYCIV